MDANLRRTIILDNYQNPMHKGLVNDDGYIRIRTNNESCIDDLTILIKVVISVSMEKLVQFLLRQRRL